MNHYLTPPSPECKSDNYISDNDRIKLDLEGQVLILSKSWMISVINTRSNPTNESFVDLLSSSSYLLQSAISDLNHFEEYKARIEKS